MQRTCNDRKLLQAAYGEPNAKKIERRLFELYSVDDLSQIPVNPPARRHLLTGNRAGQFAVVVKEPFRIIFIPMNDPLPILPDGGIDINKVTKIKIIEIGDYHGE